MIIIPARLQSTRFPRKMLADVLGIPMVIRTALNAKEVDEVVVATDSQEILEVCKRYKIQAILTDHAHTSGTDRCAEAGRILGLKEDEIVINMQGDEPFLEKEVLEAMKQLMRQTQAFMGTCIKEISKEQAQCPNLVKVVLSCNKEAIYFSRSPIPYDRENQNQIYYGHLGIYAFKHVNLQAFCALPKSQLEEIEKLEQLRAIWNQKSIATTLVQSRSFGIDTQEDLKEALTLFA